MASQPNSNHYQTLGIRRSAKLVDITRAYKKHVKANQRDDVAPDPRRDERIQNAYATLSDEASREAYDKTLLVRKAGKGGLMLGLSLGGAALVVAGATWYLNRPVAAPAKPSRTVAQIRVETLRSIARVQSIGVSGAVTGVGLAFAIERGVMGAPCEGLTPGAQITVDLGDRNASARVLERDDASGFCKLAVDNAASWPLPLGTSYPHPNDPVFVAIPAADGTLALRDATVKKVGNDAGGFYFVVSVELPAGAQGGPLVDATGRVLGVAKAAGGTVRFVQLPAVWLQEKVALPREPARSVETVEEGKGDAAAAPVSPMLDPNRKAPASPLDFDPKRKEELRKAFRPDPNVPSDL